MLDDTEATINTLKSKSGPPKPNRQMKNYALNELNMFLKKVAKQSPGLCLNVDFWKNGLSSQLSGYFGENGFTRMLDASDSEKGDQIGLFWEQSLTYCVETGTPLISRHVLHYIQSYFWYSSKSLRVPGGQRMSWKRWEPILGHSRHVKLLRLQITIKHLRWVLKNGTY